MAMPQPTGQRRSCARNSPNGAGARARRRCGARCIDWATAGNARNSCWAGPIRRTLRKKAVAQQAAAMVAAGGEVWFGDETTVREFPPLRACWAKQGEQREVVI